MTTPLFSSIFDTSFSATPGPTVTWVGVAVDGENTTFVKSVMSRSRVSLPPDERPQYWCPPDLVTTLRSCCAANVTALATSVAFSALATSRGVMRASTTCDEYDETAY
jgi:hypothetical protein